ncbi:PAS domain S-box protein [bacterium]|nr:MAG: PAS domain S-box protein [bacterium]
MKNEDKTKEKLIKELVELHKRINELEKLESHRKKAEMENEERRLYLEAVLADAPDAIITMDAQHKIIMCNQVAEKLFGYSKKEMIGKNIDDLIAGADKFEEAKLYSKQVLAGENIPTIETVRYRKDGAPVDVVMAGSPILIGNKLVGAVAVYTDISKRKQMEVEIKKYSLELEHKIEELRKVNDELSQYTYAVSHDLRAPLRALNNYCRFLQEDCSDSLDDIGQEYIQGIAENVWHMEELVTDLLEYSIIGKTRPKITNVNVGKLLARLVSQLHPDENVEITLPKKDIIIQANEIQLEQIFSNLLSNAFKFNQSSKPHISIEHREIGDAWEFSVRDNGIGIESRYFDKIFGIFQRLHTQEEYEGTGIGLAIVKKAVEQHGGTIWVESTPGKGSIVTFTLPKIKSEQLDQKTG